MRRTKYYFDSSGHEQVQHLAEMGIREVQSVHGLFSGVTLGRLIRDEQFDCMLCCHGAVSLPYSCMETVAELISDMDRDYGPHGWAMVGNAGIEALSLRSVRMRYDQRLSVVPSPCTASLPAVGIDPHLLLLNADALRREGIYPPEEPRWDAVAHHALLVQSWERGLACLLDSRLYAHHKFFPVRHRTVLRRARQYFTNYPAADLSIDRFGVVSIGKKGGDRRFHQHVLATMRSRAKKQAALKVHVLVRTRLRRPQYLRRLLHSVRMAGAQDQVDFSLHVLLSVNNVPLILDRNATLSSLLREFEELDIAVVDGDQGPAFMFPRVRAIAAALDVLPARSRDYVWIVDDDDFIMSENMQYLNMLLMNRGIVVGDSMVFKETWAEADQADAPVTSTFQSRYDGARYYEILNGHNFVPVCSVLFPCSVLQKTFERHQLRGDYFEDYMLLTASMLMSASRHYPVALAGISMHGDNTVLERDKIRWNHSYATFMAELARRGALPNCCQEYISAVNIWFQERQLVKEILARLPGASQGARAAGLFLDWLARWKRF